MKSSMGKLLFLVALGGAVLSGAIAERQLLSDGALAATFVVDWENPPKKLELVCGDLIQLFWDSSEKLDLMAVPTGTCPDNNDMEHKLQLVSSPSKMGSFVYHTSPQVDFSFVDSRRCGEGHTMDISVKCNQMAHLIPLTEHYLSTSHKNYDVDWATPPKELDVLCGDTVTFTWANGTLDLWEMKDGDCPKDFENSATAVRLLGSSKEGSYVYFTGPQAPVDFADHAKCGDGHRMLLNVSCVDSSHLSPQVTYIDELNITGAGVPRHYNIDWNSPPPLLAAKCGDTVTFTWDAGEHDLWEIPTNDECPASFEEGERQIQLAGGESSGNFTYVIMPSKNVRMVDSRDCKGHTMDLLVGCIDHSHLAAHAMAIDFAHEMHEDKEEEGGGLPVVLIVLACLAGAALLAGLGFFAYKKHARSARYEIASKDTKEAAPEGDDSVIIPDENRQPTI